MSYTASQLITKSWYLSGIVARNFETVSGDQITDGLALLNALLDFKSSDVRLIPYFTLYEVDLIQGQEMYFIPGLVQCELMTFNIGNVRFPMSPANRVKYFGSGRVDNINAIPFEWHLERVYGGSNLYVYYLPMANYVAHISGKFALTDVTLNEDMSLVYDNFYIEYLRYALAQFFCNEYDISFAPEKLLMLRAYEKKLTDVSATDLIITKTQFIQDKRPLNWAQINVGRGWVP